MEGGQAEAVFCRLQGIRHRGFPLSITIEPEGHCYSRQVQSHHFKDGVEAFNEKR